VSGGSHVFVGFLDYIKAFDKVSYGNYYINCWTIMWKCNCCATGTVISRHVFDGVDACQTVLE